MKFKPPCDFDRSPSFNAKGQAAPKSLHERIKNNLIHVDGAFYDDFPNEEMGRTFAYLLYSNALRTLYKRYEKSPVIRFFSWIIALYRELRKDCLYKPGFNYQSVFSIT